MIRFVAGRLVQAVAVVLVVATLTFVLLRAAPGDPLTAISESRMTPPEVVEQRKRNLGLDRPIHVQYLLYVSRLARGDFGTSYTDSRPVWHWLRETIPNTLILAGAAIILDFTLGIALGVFQATRAGPRLDGWLSVASLSVYSMPSFWLGIMLLLLFGQTLGWLPAGGMFDPVLYSARTSLARLVDLLWHLVLPAVTLGLIGGAATARFQRAEMLETVHQDFVRTARAKGLPERAVLLRHALRNALLPTITLLGLSLPILLSGSVLVETVFAWPGVGRMAALAVFRRDYDVVTGAAILAAAMVVVGNLVSDLLYWVVDPRTRESA